MTEGFVLGVDLGTSHTVAMLRRPDGRTRPLLFDGRPLLPSAVHLDISGRLHVGADAIRLGHADPGRLEPHPKRHIDDDLVMLGDGATVPVADLLAALLTEVAREAVATTGFLPPATVTYPASWGAPRRAVLTEALGKAGWPPETALLPEPVAAARYFAEVLRRPLPVGRSLAVFDLGGGTLDIAVVRHDGPGAAFSVTASGGADDLGGLDVDAALAEHLGKSLAGSEPEAWRTLTEPVSLAQWRARRQFWEDVRGAKEMLSRSSFAPIAVPGVEHAVHLTREELEAAADPLVRRGVSEAAAVIEAAGLKPAELAGLFLVGGSSRIPLVARLLHAELGIAPTVLEQPELPVAEGATLPPASDPMPGSHTAAASASGPHTAAASADSLFGPTTGVPVSPAAPAPAPADDRHYAEPVDPWAEASGALPSSAGPGSYGPPSAEPWLASDTPRPAEPRRNRRLWLVASAAITAAAVFAGAGLTWAFWPKYPALDYQTLGEPVRVTPAVPLGSAWKDAVVRGDRAYLGSADYDSGRVGVVAIDTGSTKPAWTNADIGTAQRWQSMVALPGGVALFSETDTGTDSSRLIVLGADRGDKLWQRTLKRNDLVYFVGDSAVVADRTGKQLLGLDVGTGEQKWRMPDPEGSTPPAVVAVTTPTDLGGPATPTGRPLAPDLGDDPRLVQIGGDRGARVIDANTGKVLASRPNVARPDDEVIAHNGRLIVRGSEDIHRIVTYGLDNLDGDAIAYTAQSATARLTGLTPCGDNRVCMIEGTGYGDEQARVVAVDVAENKRLWQAAAPSADKLIPVGEAVLVTYSNTTRLIDANGAEMWSRKAAAARLDAGNVLEFSKPFAGYADDPALAGRHLGDDPVQLGPLAGIQTESCSWNATHLACAADKDFVLIKYAG